MELARFLRENQGEIQRLWIERVLAGYATATFQQELDRFANPVGYSTRQALSAVYSLLFACPNSDSNQGSNPNLNSNSNPRPNLDWDQLRGELASLVKLRAVQTFTPSSAVLFVFELKSVVRQLAAKERQLVATEVEWERFHDIIDRVALIVFDLYMASRERLLQVQLNEIKSMNYLHTRRGCSAARSANKD